MSDAARAARALCFAQSPPCDQGVFRCTLAKGHTGAHQSAQAHWWDDPDEPASHVPAAASSLLREGVRYWIEIRHSGDEHWIAWLDTPDGAAALDEFKRLQAEFPTAGWRLGQTYEKVEVLDATA